MPDPQRPIGYDKDGNPVIGFDREGKPVLASAVSTGPGPAKRFAMSAFEQLNPVAAVKGLYDMAVHPYDTAAMIGFNSAVKGRESFEAAQRGNYGDAATSAVGAIPFIGPPLERGIQQVREGDYAGAAGTAAGLAVPYTRPLKTAKAASLGVARTVAPGATARAASRLDKLAASKVGEAISPQVGANKVRIANDAAKVAPGLLERGLTNRWSREGLHDNVKAGLDGAVRQLDEAVDARPSWKDFETAEIVKALEAKKAEVQAEAIQASKWPRRIDEETQAPVTEPYGESQTAAPIRERVARINEAITEVKGLGPSARYEALRKLRAGWDEEAKAKYSPAVTPDYIKNTSRASGAADVTGALREYLASKDSRTAAANAEFSFFKRADDVLKAVEEVERARPNVGRKVMSRVAGSIAGSQVAGLMGAIAGYALAPAAQASIGMGVTTKLKLATGMKNLATAIRSGHADGVNFYARQLRRTLAQAGVQVENLQDAQEKK